MCKHGTLKQISVIRRANPIIMDGWHKINVDSCISDRLQKLNDKGIVTLNSCCGHGKDKGNILFDSKFKKQMEMEGYKVGEYTPEHAKNNILIAYI